METLNFLCYLVHCSGRRGRSCYPFVLLAVINIFTYIETKQYNELNLDVDLEDLDLYLSPDTYLLL